MAAKSLKASPLPTSDSPSAQPVVMVARPAGAPLTAPSSVDTDQTRALARLNDAVAELKAQALNPYLHQAILDIQADQPQSATNWATKALEIDERSALAWQLLGIAREQTGDFLTSLKCFESAILLDPDNSEIANDLGRLAFRMGMKEMASRFFSYFLARNPGSPDGANNLACALRDEMRFNDAIEVIRPAIYAHPDKAMLWNTLGSILVEQGDLAEGVTFFDESLRLDESHAKARYNRGNARAQLGDALGGLDDVEKAIPGVVLESEVAMMKLARSSLLLSCGRLGEGWDAYEERLNVNFADVTHFLVDRPSWTPDSELKGKSLLVIGEQGLGDEVMFAGVLPDLIKSLGPKGKLWLAVEPRLVPLMQRSFPKAVVGSHVTYRVNHHVVRGMPFIDDAGGFEQIDIWTPLASPLRRFRRSVEDFPERTSYLVPDPERVEHWRAILAELGDAPKVGVLWKSLKNNSGRMRYFSPFEQWRPVLDTPGLRFVNLQYGDCDDELAMARDMGIDIWNPPGIDLKADLDDVAALTSAMDLVVGPANATTNIAAACGAPVWMISTPGAWPKLGSGHYPWYPQVRVFNPPGYNNWDPVMQEVAVALAETYPPKA